MYSIGRRVYVKPLDRLGIITEANYVGNPRKAHYIVDLGDGGDCLVGPSNLCGADYQCDGCSKHRPGQPYKTYINPSDGWVEAIFCFPCVKQGERDERKAEEEAMAIS